MFRSAAGHHRETSYNQTGRAHLQKCVFSVILKLKEVEHMEQIIQLISNVGFPIACCIFLFSQQTKLTNTLHDISTTMQLMSSRLDDIEDAMRKGGEHGKKEKERT